jgi:hypothetical protein
MLSSHKAKNPVLILLLIILSSCSVLADLPELADDFFAKIKAKKYKAAYELTSKEFKEATTLENLITFLELYSLQENVETSWPTRTVENGIGNLEGIVKLKDGTDLKINMSFVKENKSWKILSMNIPTSVAEDMQSTKEIPPIETLRELVNASVYNLGVACNSQNFNDFYSYISKFWQAQTKPDTLMKTFKVFHDLDIDLTIVNGLEPVLSDKPVIDNDDLLRMKGYYATSPNVIYYEVSYIFEYPEWKLFGISVNVE